MSPQFAELIRRRRVGGDAPYHGFGLALLRGPCGLPYDCHGLVGANCTPISACKAVFIAPCDSLNVQQEQFFIVPRNASRAHAVSFLKVAIATAQELAVVRPFASSQEIQARTQ